MPCNCPSVNKSDNVHGQTDYICSYNTKTFCHTPYCSSLLFMEGQITLAHITPKPSATPPTAPPSCSWTDRLHLLILHQDLLPHPLLLLPPVHGRTDYTCSYYTKTFCHTPYCSSLLFTDGQITLAHITLRPSATPSTAPPSCSRTDRLHLLILHQDLLPHPLLLLPPVHR